MAAEAPRPVERGEPLHASEEPALISVLARESIVGRASSSLRVPAMRWARAEPESALASEPEPEPEPERRHSPPALARPARCERGLSDGPPHLLVVAAPPRGRTPEARPTRWPPRSSCASATPWPPARPPVSRASRRPARCTHGTSPGADRYPRHHGETESRRDKRPTEPGLDTCDA